jgi:hypothetical protein
MGWVKFVALQQEAERELDLVLHVKLETKLASAGDKSAEDVELEKKTEF